MPYYIYILASKPYGTLYIGMTSKLVERVYQHKDKAVPGFTAKYLVDKLVYFEKHETAENAIRREKQLKKWNRQWKIHLIEEDNPDWQDLYSSIAV